MDIFLWQVIHNIAVAEYFRDGCSDPRKLLEVLNKVKVSCTFGTLCLKKNKKAICCFVSGHIELYSFIQIVILVGACGQGWTCKYKLFHDKVVQAFPLATCFSFFDRTLATCWNPIFDSLWNISWQSSLKDLTMYPHTKHICYLDLVMPVINEWLE